MSRTTLVGRLTGGETGSAQQRLGEFLRAEGLQILEFLADADEVDRYLAAGLPGPHRDRGQHAALGGAIELGHDQAGQLQRGVEGLSIAAISYYVVSLLLYGAKALKGLGLPLQPELTAGALIPVVLWGVWRTTRRIHEKLHSGH